MIKNKKLYHDYEVFNKIECGIMLRGYEVKAIRAHKLSFSNSYVYINSDDVPILSNFSIGEEKPIYIGTMFYYKIDYKRDRTLLLHKKEILKLKQSILQKGYTLIPSAIYFNNNKVKVEIAVCKGLKNYNKKEKIKEKDLKKIEQREVKKIW